MAVTDYAPYFFIVDTASKSSMIPSLMFLDSKDLIIYTLCPRTESKIWIFIYPSLNLVHIRLPNPISRWLAISLASISTSNAKILRFEN